MKIRASFCHLLVVLTVLTTGCLYAQRGAPSTKKNVAQEAMDRDLLEVTIPKLEQLYRSHKYTVTEVVRWYIARIEKYNGIYRAVQNLDVPGALATAAHEDAEAKAGGNSYVRGPMWGIPIVVKANTSIKGLITTHGWKGYTIPGHELVAPKDATIIAKLRAAGVVILGQTNMPDFAASDTNRSTAYGRTGNAYDVRFSPGGSSGGTIAFPHLGHTASRDACTFSRLILRDLGTAPTQMLNEVLKRSASGAGRWTVRERPPRGNDARPSKGQNGNYEGNCRWAAPARSRP